MKGRFGYGLNPEKPEALCYQPHQACPQREVAIEEDNRIGGEMAVRWIKGNYQFLSAFIPTKDIFTTTFIRNGVKIADEEGRCEELDFLKKNPRLHSVGKQSKIPVSESLQGGADERHDGPV